MPPCGAPGFPRQTRARRVRRSKCVVQAADRLSGRSVELTRRGTISAGGELSHCVTAAPWLSRGGGSAAGVPADDARDTFCDQTGRWACRPILNAIRHANRGVSNLRIAAERGDGPAACRRVSAAGRRAVRVGAVGLRHVAVMALWWKMARLPAAPWDGRDPPISLIEQMAGQNAVTSDRLSPASMRELRP